MQAGSVLRLCTKFDAESSFRSKVIRESRNFDIGSRDPGHAHFDVVLSSIGRQGVSSVSVPNLKQIGQFVQKLLKGSRNYEIRSRDPSHAQLRVVLWSLHKESLSCMSVSNLKWIALFVQKLLGWSQISPCCRPLHRGEGPPKFSQLEMFTTCTYRPSLVKIDACIFRVIVVTDTTLPPAKDRTNYNTLRRS